MFAAEVGTVHMRNLTHFELVQCLLYVFDSFSIIKKNVQFP